MRLPFDLPMPDRRRVTSFVLALAVEIALIAFLILFGPQFTPFKKDANRTVSFSTLPDAEKDAANSPDHKDAAKSKPSAVNGAATPNPAEPLPPPPIIPPDAQTKPNGFAGVLPIDLGAKDISKLKSSGDDDGDADSKGADSKLAYGPGLGPGGMPLYRAEWYREPSNAELNGYLKSPPPNGGWALIACRTIENYHVDNCRTLGESPPGSGLARDMRLAAWQFLVRPPRRGGKALVGSWVSIRIDFHTTLVKSPGGGSPGRARDGGMLPPEPKPRYAPDPAEPSEPVTAPSGGFTLPPDPKKRYGPEPAAPRGGNGQ